jgi:formate dehydrogenase major subunit
VPGLGTSFGRGGATTAQQDLANADCILIEGSSMAEAHPVGFRWVLKAKERGATIIHVDPRFSRTSALADLWVPIRAGADLVFLGGLVRHVLENRLFFREYVLHYTNASCLVRDDFRDTEDLDGLFSGWDPERRTYETESWRYEGDDLARPLRDPTLEHPRCVFQLLRRHFTRYTPEMVEKLAGVPPDLFGRVADAFTSASGREKTAAICYALGWTQHSKGVQIIRTAAILQLLLGNVGRPGGGILALRGHASIQGSTDIPTLFDILPGYLPMPKAGTGEDDLAGYVRNHRKVAGQWSALPAYVTSLLKAWYGRRATPESDSGYRFLPQVSRDHSHFSFITEMADGHVDGFFVMGQNPAVGAQHSRLERKALARLRWLVVRDMVEIETASFWYDSPEIETGELTTANVATEVFLFPAAGHAEKEGTFTNTQRLLQWREQAVDPPGDARSEAWFIHQLAKRLRSRAAAAGDPLDEPLRALDWWYPEDEHGEPHIEAVLAEINGWRSDPAEAAAGLVHSRDAEDRPHHGPQVKGFGDLRDDGSTACGCWIYSGVLGPDGVNRARQREPSGAYAHGWGFAWPADRRILYNRASAAPDGTPWSDRKKLVWWDDTERRWTGDDVPDFVAEKPPDYVPPPDATGLAAQRGDAPFLLHEDGLGWLYVPEGLKDGPLPTHYEPLESVADNALYGRATNPAVRWFVRDDNRFAPPKDPRFPYVLTTYRLTEHHTAGGMSRFLSHLAELQPELFVEISPELAGELGVASTDWVTVSTLRGIVEARALVSRRMRPLQVDGRIVHQVAMPFHWGSAGPNRGDVVNDLIPLSGEPNVTIHEGKALLCSVTAGRRPRGRDVTEALDRLVRETPPHPEAPSTEPRPSERPGGHGHHGKTT